MKFCWCASVALRFRFNSSVLAKFSSDYLNFCLFLYSFILLWIMNILHAFDLNTIFIIQNTQFVFVCTLSTCANASSTKDEERKKHNKNMNIKKQFSYWSIYEGNRLHVYDAIVPEILLRPYCVRVCLCLDIARFNQFQK